MLKSIAAVVGSYVLSIVLVLASDPLLSRVSRRDSVKGNIPSNNELAATTEFFRSHIHSCAWIYASFAPRQPGKHVLWFFILGEVMGIAAVIPNWSKGWPLR